MSTAYDQQFISLDHFRRMPEQLPFIGEHWNKQVERILFVAESHYVNVSDFVFQNDTSKLDIAKPALFYEIQSYELKGGFKAYFNTRQIIEDVDTGKNLKGKEIYINLKKVLAEYAGIPSSARVLNYFSIYNYFQRPSYAASDTINNTAFDDKIAFDTLAHIAKIIKPTIIFFISAKAHNTFVKTRKGNLQGEFEAIKIYCAPHPARAWWNRASAEYNNMPGKDFMKYILSTKRKIIK